MADNQAGESKILATYRARTPRAAELNRRARSALPGGSPEQPGKPEKK